MTSRLFCSGGYFSEKLILRYPSCFVQGVHCLVSSDTLHVLSRVSWDTFMFCLGCPEIHSCFVQGVLLYLCLARVSCDTFVWLGCPGIHLFGQGVLGYLHVFSRCPGIPFIFCLGCTVISFILDIVECRVCRKVKHTCPCNFH